MDISGRLIHTVLEYQRRLGLLDRDTGRTSQRLKSQRYHRIVKRVTGESRVTLLNPSWGQRPWTPLIHIYTHTHTIWHSDGATQPDPRESDCSAAATSSVSLTDTLCLSSVTLRFQSAVPDGAARLVLLLFSHSRLLLTLSRWNKSGRVFLFYMKITHPQFLCNYCYQGQTFCAHHVPETFSWNWKKAPMICLLVIQVNLL